MHKVGSRVALYSRDLKEITAAFLELIDAAHAVASIEEVTDVIGKIKDVSSTIAAAVEEQSVTSNEISQNMSVAAMGMRNITDNVSTVAEAAAQTSKGAADTLNSALDLAKLAGDLDEIVKSL